MYKNPNNPKATREGKTGTIHNVPEREIQPHLIDFDLWLENELVQLEARYASFTTTTSNRNFFDRKSRNVG